MEIEGACRLVDELPLPPDEAFLLRAEAQRRSTRFSTAIEGNTIRLETLARGIALGDRAGTRQQQEVRNYWSALEWLERQAEQEARFSEDFIRRLHRIIIVLGRGRRGQMSSYRTEECPVVDSATGAVDYGPPSPGDVGALMAALVAWRNSAAAAELPGPVRAAILTYQFVTIHPFADGNGRTARALGTWELWSSGYRMRGFLSVEEEYHRDLPRYYGSLQMGLPWNYYCGRNDPDLTPWLSYFVETMAAAALGVRDRALSLRHAAPPPRPAWEGLTRPQQQLLTRLLLAGTDGDTNECPTFAPGDVAEWFGVSPATARQWLDDWRGHGLIVPASGDERVRRWALREDFAALVSMAISASREAQIAQAQTGRTGSGQP